MAVTKGTLTEPLPPEPTLGQYDHIHRSALLQDLRVEASRLDSSDGPLLDIGCGYRPYRSLFPIEQIGVDYTALDASPHLLATAEALPLRDGAVGVVLSTQYLEHASEPAMTLLEMRRVLRPGGRLLLSTHGVFPHHAHPNDFWRWTEEGLRRQVAAAGFDVDAIHRHGGIVSAGLLLATYPLGFERSSHTARLVSRVAIAALNRMGLVGDRVVARVSDHHYGAISYLVAATADVS